MSRLSTLLVSLLLAGCATVAPPGPVGDLFHDDLFAKASTPVTGDDVFELSPAMRKFVDDDLAYRLHVKGPVKGLVDALYSQDALKLTYDAAMTRTAAETFDARAGNCLSLAIMTAAFAKRLKVPIQFQTVLTDDYWSRVGDMYFASSHVNVTLSPTRFGKTVVDDRVAPITIDFLAQGELMGQRVRSIEESTVVAMYMNNRAAETLAAGKLDDAYWWARSAIVQDPGFLSSYNTLGVVYRQHGNAMQAEQSLRYALALDHDNTLVMSNLARVYDDEGRHDLAQALDAQVARLEPDQPFFYFNRGMTAMRNHDYRAAKDLFEKEARRDPYYHETQFWLAVASLGLGETAEAREHLAVALQNSTTRGERALYAAKLDRLNATVIHN